MNLDVKNLTCPQPVLNAKKAYKDLGPDEALVIEANSEIVTNNLKRFASSAKLACEVEKQEGGVWVLTMTPTDESKAYKEAFLDGNEGTVCDPNSGANRDFVIAIHANHMGNGDETLGAKLIGAFIFTLTQVEEKPSKILFYNSGVLLTSTEGKVLEDLKSLAEDGVEIYSCGTCTSFYKVTPMVGEVVDMYTIYETMAHAGKIITP